jgi:hypothetical protein
MARIGSIVVIEAPTYLQGHHHYKLRHWASAVSPLVLLLASPWREFFPLSDFRLTRNSKDDTHNQSEHTNFLDLFCTCLVEASKQCEGRSAGSRENRGGKLSA